MMKTTMHNCCFELTEMYSSLIAYGRSRQGEKVNHTYAHAHMDMHTCEIHMHMCIYKEIHMHLCSYMWMQAYMHTHIHTHLYMNTHAHTYIHITCTCKDVYTHTWKHPLAEGYDIFFRDLDFFSSTLISRT